MYTFGLQIVVDIMLACLYENSHGDHLTVLQCWITRCRLCDSLPVCYVLFHVCTLPRTPYKAWHYWISFQQSNCTDTIL